MSDKEVSCEWVGVSGDRYKYYVYGFSTTFVSGQMGNYIFCRINDEGNWEPIRFGEGDLGLEANKNCTQAMTAKNLGATHVHARVNEAELSRKAELFDLLANYPDAQFTSSSQEIFRD